MLCKICNYFPATTVITALPHPLKPSVCFFMGSNTKIEFFHSQNFSVQNPTVKLEGAHILHKEKITMTDENWDKTNP